MRNFPPRYKACRVPDIYKMPRTTRVSHPFHALPFTLRSGPVSDREHTRLSSLPKFDLDSTTQRYVEHPNPTNPNTTMSLPHYQRALVTLAAPVQWLTRRLFRNNRDLGNPQVFPCNTTALFPRGGSIRCIETQVIHSVLHNPAPKPGYAVPSEMKPCLRWDPMSVYSPTGERIPVPSSTKENP